MKTPPKILEIDNESDLEKWLIEHGIDLSQWGCDHAKSVQNLLKEIQEGDCIIQYKPPLRIIHVVQALIFKDKYILTELGQELSDNRKRKRNLPPSEKMKPDENCLFAAIRCLDEELQITDDRITFLSKKCKPVIRYRYSKSYPGLKSKYYIYRVHVQVNGLPEKNFWSEEKNSGDHQQSVRRHFWGWTQMKNIKFSD